MNLDVDRFMKDIESMLGSQGADGQADDDSDGSEGSSMDMDFGISYKLISFSPCSNISWSL